MYFKHKKLIQKICKGICTMAVLRRQLLLNIVMYCFISQKNQKVLRNF